MALPGRKALYSMPSLKRVSHQDGQFVVFVQKTHRWLGSGHQSPGLWRHPDDQSVRFNDVDHWIDLAKLLEKGKFHGMFIADVLGMQYRNFSGTSRTEHTGSINLL